MKIVKRTLLDKDVELFDSDTDQGIVTIKVADDFELSLELGELHGEPVVRLLLQAGVGTGRLVVYPQVTNGIALGKSKL